MWRVVIYLFLPAAFALSIVFLVQGMPMTFQSAYQVNTLEPAAMGTDNNNQPKQQTIVVGPLAAFVPMKMLGTNGGGFYGMNSAHPFENPTAGSNIITTSSFMLFPMALVLMYGRMLSRRRHANVIFAVMLTLLVGTVLWAIYFDTLKPNPGFTAHPGPQNFEIASATAPGGKRVITHACGGSTAGRSASWQSRREGTSLRDFCRFDLCRTHRRFHLRRDYL